MSTKLNIGMLIDVVQCGEEIIDLLSEPSAEALVKRMKALVEGDEFTRGPKMHEVIRLRSALDRLVIHLKILRRSEIGGSL